MLLASQIPSDLYSFSHHRNTTRLDIERIGALQHLSQRKGGLWGTVHERLLPRKQQSAAEEATEQEDVPQRIGMGLPLSNIYATYFGGSLDLVSMDGWGKFPMLSIHSSHAIFLGTDVYLRLPRLGTNLEDIEV